MRCNEKAENDEAYAGAYKKCVEDAKEKVKSQNQVADLAKENAVNFIKAVTEPFLKKSVHIFHNLSPELNAGLPHSEPAIRIDSESTDKPLP